MSKKFQIEAKYTETRIIEIEADDLEDANKKADDLHISDPPNYVIYHGSVSDHSERLFNKNKDDHEFTITVTATT